MRDLRRICFRERLEPVTPADGDLPPMTTERYTISYWLEFADGCLYISAQDMNLYRVASVPADAKPIPVVDDELTTDSMPLSFLGASLVSIVRDAPYLMRFDNGGIIDFVFDFFLYNDGPRNSYLSPDFFSPSWFAAPENVELKENFALDEDGEKLIDLASLPAAKDLFAETSIPTSCCGRPPDGRVTSLLRLYGLLFWCAFILFPLIAGLGVWQPAAVLFFWFAVLLLRRVCAECRLGWLGALLCGISAVIICGGYDWWRARISSPTPFAEGWYWPCGLDFPAPTQLQLLGMATICLVGTLLMSHPRWHWLAGRKDELPLLPWLALGIPLAWGINEALLWLYLNGLLPLLMPADGH